MSPESSAPSFAQWLSGIAGSLGLGAVVGMFKVRDQTRDHAQRINVLEKARESDKKLLVETHDAVLRIEGKLIR